MSEVFKALPPIAGGADQSQGLARAPRPVAGGMGPMSMPRADRSSRLHFTESHEQPRTDSVSLDDLFSRLWGSKLALIGGALAGALAMIALASLSTPVYRARTSIRLEELNERFPNLPEMFSADAAAPSEIYLQNELKILGSDTLAKRVARQLNFEPAPDTASFITRLPFSEKLRHLMPETPPASPDEERIRAMQKALTVRSSLKSQVIEVLFDSKDPDLAAKGANAVVSEYIAMNRESRLQISRDKTDWLSEQISDLKAKLDKGNAELQAFTRSSGLLIASNQSLLSEERARAVQDQLSKARAERAAREAVYEAALSNSPEALPANADTGLLRDYEGRLATARSELNQFRGMYTPAHYKVLEAESRVTQLEATVKTERQRIIARMKAEFDASRRLEDSLAVSYAANARDLTQDTAAAFRYGVLKRDLDSTELLYNSLVQKAKEAGVTSAMKATSVRVIDAATTPSTPYSPNLPLNGSIGLAGGLLLAAAIVLIRHGDPYQTNQSVESQKIVVRELGAIPFAKRMGPRRWPTGLLSNQQNRPAVEMVTWYEQPSILTEAFRATLASILFSPVFDRQDHLILTVTSVRPQEGKTTAVSNLGIALAETHGRVLLIDADLRRPRIHEIFGHCNDVGLSTILTGDEPIATLDLDKLLRKTDVPGLFTLPSGPGTPSVTPLLYSARMSAFMARMKKEFDYVLIDTPPASLFSDARILGRHSDGLIVVIHSEKTTRGDLNSTCASFVKDGTRVVGAIVNHRNIKTRGYENYKQQPA